MSLKGKCHKKQPSHTHTHMLIDCEHFARDFRLHSISKVCLNQRMSSGSDLFCCILHGNMSKATHSRQTTNKKKIRIIHLITQQIQIYFDSNNNSCHWMIVSVHPMPMCEPIFFGLSDNYSHSAKALMCNCVQRWHIWFAWKENAFYGVTLWITTTTSATTKNRFTLTHDANF